MNIITHLTHEFMRGWKEEGHKRHSAEDKKLRDNLKEHQVDNMVIDSFPASDPPSTY